ncbi:hypothetical protein CASFOL_033939 [Castilleja foliolosa]|uniref:Uncharacterized protein n=1 Tax=Castilleja foliolosa TaxID=1961234 RepID=A0ABD3BYD7_9LAMI
MEVHNVQIISRENIKPSSPTPHHQHHLKLSYLDQLSPHLYFPAIFFYQAHQLATSNHVQMSQHLKQSLSHTLTTFYPFAGRLQGDSTLRCNDAGVDFVHARAHAHLINDVITQQPNVHEDLLKRYLPVDPTIGGLCNETTLLVVQVTFFDCGGVSIGMCFSHRVADCASIMKFLDVWTATCRTENNNNNNNNNNNKEIISFDLANYFPTRDFSGIEIPRFPISDKDFWTKRFVFDKVKLAALSQLATIKDPTRVELVSAFIWKSFIEMTTKPNRKKVFAAFHAVNLRTRVDLENAFGNCLMSAIASTDSSSGGTEESQDLVNKLRRSIRRIDKDYIWKARDNGDGYLSDLFEYLSLLQKGELEYCRFSSWCSFPVYEVDFGWGKPVCVGTAGVPLKNVIVLVNSRCGEGIEAWVKMNQHNLQVLETKFKLICG